jgi:hypothetical protein
MAVTISGARKLILRSYLLEIRDIVERIEPDRGPAATCSMLSQMERRIVEDRELSETAEALLLSTTSVARHSVEYRMHEAQTGDSIWFDPRILTIQTVGRL